MLNELRLVVEHNYRMLEHAEGDQSRAEGLITFLCVEENVNVFDPFYDTTLRVVVDPIEEYGEDNIKKMITEFKTRG